MKEKIVSISFQQVEEIPTVYEVKELRTYGSAKRNLEDLRNTVVEILVSGQEENEELQKKIDLWEDAVKHQEESIRNFVENLPSYSAKFIGDNIKYLLDKENMRISDLESLLGVSSGYVSRTINPESKKRLSIDVVWQVSQIFSINIDDLLNRNLCDPPKTIIPIVEFMNKLKKETEEAKMNWKNMGTKPTEVTSILFSTFVKDDETQQIIYSPQGYGNETSGLSLRGDIYITRLNGNELLVVPVEDYLFETKGVEFYVVEYIPHPYEPEEVPSLNRLCGTIDDGTNTLNVTAEELLNTIKLHETDFRVSDSAKSFIDNYLHPCNFDDETPFN